MTSHLFLTIPRSVKTVADAEQYYKSKIPGVQVLVAGSPPSIKKKVPYVTIMHDKAGVIIGGTLTYTQIV